MAAVAIIGGAVVGAGASIYGASETAGAQTSAASSVSDATKYAADLQYKEWQQTQANLQPWLTAGTGALNQLAVGTQAGGQFATTPAVPTAPTFGAAPQYTPFTPEAFQANIDPGYQWRLQQGVNALASSGAASGTYGSGNMGTALTQFGQGLGSEEYQNAYNRSLQSYNAQLAGYQTGVNAQSQQYNAAIQQFNAGLISQQDLYNRLAGISGTGQTTGQQLGQLGLQSVTQIGNLGVQGATALATGQVGSANALAGGITGISNQMTSGVGQYLNYLYGQNYGNQSNDLGWGGLGMG
jgi:hypothetical protein